MDSLFDHKNNLSLLRKTNGKLPSLPFARIKNDILGKDYDLSVVFPNLAEATRLHKEWKKKNSPVNILSFPLSKNEGEIILSLSQARREAKKYDRTYIEHLTCLFIHGCAHLKGHVHGHKMDVFEKKFQKKFLNLS